MKIGNKDILITIAVTTFLSLLFATIASPYCLVALIIPFLLIALVGE
jgi:hypothetical protein